MRFIIVATGYNCEEQINNCLLSIHNQTYENFIAIAISDGSTDKTILQPSKLPFIDNRIIVVGYTDNMGAAKRRYDAIKKYATSPEDVIVLVGLDDAIFPNCLERVYKEYKKGKWMTYGNWINEKGIGLPKTFDLFFDKETHENRDYRKVTYRSTAVNTFKRFLFDEIPEDDFKINGVWIDSTTESELMFSCLEMCGETRIGVITESIYFYNQYLPNNTLRRLGVRYKQNILDVIKNRPKKPQLFR